MQRITIKLIYNSFLLLLIVALVLPSRGYADNNIYHTLAPPLKTSPPCTIIKSSNGEWDVITHNDIIQRWDRELYRSEKAKINQIEALVANNPGIDYKEAEELLFKGKNAGSSFRNRWAFVDIYFLVKQALELQISEETLIPLIKKHIENRDGLSEILLEGYDIDGIKSVYEGNDIIEFILPVNRNNGNSYTLVFSLNSSLAGGFSPKVDISVEKDAYIENIARALVTKQEKHQQEDEISNKIFDEWHCKELVGLFNSTQNIEKRKEIARELKSMGVLNTRIIKDGQMEDRFRLTLNVVHKKNQYVLLLANNVLSVLATKGTQYLRKSRPNETPIVGFVGGSVRNLKTLRDLDILSLDIKDDFIIMETISGNDIRETFEQNAPSNWGSSLDFISAALITDEPGGITQSLIVWAPSLSKHGKINGGVLFPLKPTAIDDLDKNIIRLGSPIKKRTVLADHTTAKISRYYFEENDASIDPDTLNHMMSVCNEYKLLLEPLKEMEERRISNNLIDKAILKEQYNVYLLDLLKNYPQNQLLVEIILKIFAKNKSISTIDSLLDMLEKYYEDAYNTLLTKRNIMSIIAALGRLFYISNDPLKEKQIKRCLAISNKKNAVSHDVTPLLIGALIKIGKSEFQDTIRVLLPKIKLSNIAALEKIAGKMYERKYLTGLLTRLKDEILSTRRKEIIDLNVSSKDAILDIFRKSGIKKKTLIPIVEKILKERQKNSFLDFDEFKKRNPHISRKIIKVLISHLSTDFLFGQEDKEIDIPSSDETEEMDKKKVKWEIDKSTITKQFSDTLKLIKHSEKKDKPKVFLGTSWIKGYEKGRYLQYDAINPLITSIRQFCDKNGVDFQEMEDKDIFSAIENETKNNPDSKIVVLAGENTVNSDSFKPLKKSDNIFLAGVDNTRLTIDSYIRLVQMLLIVMKLAFDQPVELENPHILIKEKNGYYLLVPEAEPMDYQKYKAKYSAEIFA